ncbi:SPX domain-containing protein [Hirsutella rhossiliensis]|uniref:SPX domain-containing protein n=1 Tax=Hirsutella rhossiliensis TaxID=111463 RepID=A0A9P8MMZ9_9HYPO|nr:SPX domain-containing protein [Hirsutella rhossiliensis]KAH0957952.1 SPX domain-containing protein [Hirsutella rhossiliensis]
MKFAHDFKETLASQDFPPHWVKQAIPYGQLKKCLKKVQRELQDLGLDPETLRALLNHNTTSPVALRYKLKATNSNLVRPKLTVYVHIQDGIAVDAFLTPTSRLFFERIAAELLLGRMPMEPSPAATRSDFAHKDNPSDPPAQAGACTVPADPVTRPSYEIIEVPLVFDGEFFNLLQSDVNNLDALQAEEEKKMTTEVVELGKEVSQVSRPSRFSKNDLARWRCIFELYLDAEVFFATHERDHGARSSQKALKQLQWFQGEVDKRYLAKDFKLRESRVAFARFLNLNLDLLKNIQFQELNKLAVFKILKKFDKRTSLGVSQTFPVAIQSEGLLSRDIAKDVCAQMSQELVSVVPQLNVVMSASADNLDHKLEKYMKRYFSNEVKEKHRANEIERGIEDYGPGYTHQECLVM